MLIKGEEMPKKPSLSERVPINFQQPVRLLSYYLPVYKLSNLKREQEQI